MLTSPVFLSLFVCIFCVKSQYPRMSDQEFSCFFVLPLRRVSLRVFKMLQKLLDMLCIQATEFGAKNPPAPFYQVQAFLEALR